jgi:hypothetical protein
MLPLTSCPCLELFFIYLGCSIQNVGILPFFYLHISVGETQDKNYIVQMESEV